MIKIVHIIFVLWSALVANAQSNGQDKNVTISLHPPRSIPAASASSIMRGTNLSSSMQLNSSTVMLPTNVPTAESISTLGLIIGCIAGAVILAAVVIIICLARHSRRKPCSRKEKTVTMAMDNLAASELDEKEVCQEPDHFVYRSRDVSIKMSEHFRVSSQYPALFSERPTPGFFTDKKGDDDGREGVPKSDLQERRSKIHLTRPGLVKENITVKGGIMKIDYIELNVGPGCLAEDTEITLIKDDQNPAFKSLLDLDLVKAALRVVEFLPDGLKFLKPAELSIKYEKIASDAELCILHGSYNRDDEKTVWEQITNDIEDNRADGVVNVKINGFCFFSYIYAKRGELCRILSHVNHAFTCRAYALYRRVPFMDTIDISVVLLSKFIEKKNDVEDIQQLKDHFEAGYEIGEKGMLKRVHTDRSLEMTLGFPGIEQSTFALKVDQPELDSVGFVIDHFKGIDLKFPSMGTVEVYETHRTAPKKLLWKLNVCEIKEETIKKEEIKGQMADNEHVQEGGEEEQEQVVCRKTKLRNSEITQMSRVVGVDWDSLAGLMDIPYSDREEIRVNNNYTDEFAKAEKIFALFNGSQNFDRHSLEKFVHELGRSHVISKMLPVQNENDEDDIPHRSPSAAPPNENVVLNHTPLSPREMSRLSRKIVLDWNSLAGLMDIAEEERQNVRCNRIYNDERARAEKILSIINHQKDFSREKLANKGLKGIKKLDLIQPIETGQWRSL